MDFRWLKPTKLNLLISFVLWSANLDGIIFGLRIFDYYGNSYNHSLVSILGWPLVDFLILYFFVNLFILANRNMAHRYPGLENFWTLSPAKVKITFFLTSIALLSYLLFFSPFDFLCPIFSPTSRCLLFA